MHVAVVVYLVYTSNYIYTSYDDHIDALIPTAVVGTTPGRSPYFGGRGGLVSNMFVFFSSLFVK